MNLRKKYFLFLIFILDAIIFSFFSYKILASKFKTNTEMDVSLAPTAEVSQNIPTGTSAGDSMNFLLLGYGGAGHDGGNLSDVVMIVSVSPTKKTASFISIPRDLWVEIPVRSDIKQSYKVNAAYAIGSDDKKYGLKEPQYRGPLGGATMAKKVIGELAGVSIRNYIAIDFESFKKMIDTLGGIDVDVPVAFDDYHYPIKGNENSTCGISATDIATFHQKFSGDQLNYQFPCRYEHLHFDKGMQKMNGESALKFVRSRHSAQDGGDFARSRRQKALLLGVKDKLITVDAVKNIDNLFNDLKGLVKTDLDLKGAKTFAGLIGDPKSYRTKFFGLNEDHVLVATKSLDGQFILIPKEGENMWRGVQSYIYQESNNW